MLNRLMSALGYTLSGPREYPRAHTGGDAVSRGERWQSFYTEAGGLADIINGLRYDYFQGYTRLAADDYDGRDRAAMCDAIIAQLDASVREIIDTGKIAADASQKATRYAAMRTTQFRS